MKQELLIYKGYHNKEFCFINEAGKKINFKKSKKELIEEFELTNSKNIEKRFLARYFINETPSFDVFILSDLSVI